MNPENPLSLVGPETLVYSHTPEIITGETPDGSYYLYTQPGPNSEVNSDRIIFNPAQRRFMIVDGMGHGEIVTQALEVIAHQTQAAFARHQPFGLIYPELRSRLGEIEAEIDGSQRACLVDCQIEYGRLTWYTLGDPRILVVGTDKQHIQKGRVSRIKNSTAPSTYLTADELFEATQQWADFHPGDLIIGYTDGIPGVFKSDTIIDILTQHPDPLVSLQELINSTSMGMVAKPSVADDFSILVYKYFPLSYHATNPNQLEQLMNAHCPNGIPSTIWSTDKTTFAHATKPVNQVINIIHSFLSNQTTARSIPSYAGLRAWAIDYKDSVSQ